MAKRSLHLGSVGAAALALVLGGHVFDGSARVQAADAQGAQKPAAKARTVTIEGLDTMKYQPNVINAKAGETLRVVLKTVGKMPKVVMSHNFVLLKPGTDVNAFVNEAMKASTTAYVPASRKADILASTGLAGQGETVEVSFTVPKKPGKYTFVCTFPGHFAAGMTGTLVVS